MKWRDRVRELRRVPASSIENAPWNFRTHPEEQKQALEGSIEELGFFDPLDVWEPEPGRLMLVDGEARNTLINVTVGPDTLVPVVVTDFDEHEAKKALAIKDPIGAMAETNADRLDDILREVEVSSPALQEMLTELATDAGLYKTDDSGSGDGGDAIPETYQVVVECGSEREQRAVFEQLKAEADVCGSG